MGLSLDVVDVGVEPPHVHEIQRHPFSHFTILDAFPRDVDRKVMVVIMVEMMREEGEGLGEGREGVVLRECSIVRCGLKVEKRWRRLRRTRRMRGMGGRMRDWLGNARWSEEKRGDRSSL